MARASGSGDDGQWLTGQGETDGIEQGDASSSSGFDDRAGVGVERGAPEGSEAVRDLAEDDAGTQSLFGAVVGGRDGAIGDEDEQVLAEALDEALQFQPRLGRGLALEQIVEAGLQAGMVEGQGRIGQVPTAAANPARSFQQDLEVRGEDFLAAVDRVLNIAQQMSEADLMILGRPAHLGTDAVGHPERWTNLAEELRDHALAARWANAETGAVAMVKNPGPDSPFADAHAGFVRLECGAGQQVLPDPVRLALERRRGLPKHVGERALADLQAEQVEQQARQALEWDRLPETQIQHQGPQIGAEGRARLQPGRSTRVEPLGAAGAGDAEQCHPGYIRCDLGDLDAGG